MLGGFTDLQPVDAEVKKLAVDMKDKVEAKLNAKYTVYEPVKFCKQVVNGTNYVVEVNVDGGKAVRVKIYVPLAFRNQPPELLEAEAL